MARQRAEQSELMGEDAERLRARRDRLGMSQSQLAREAGVNRDTVAAIERGQGYRRSSLVKLEKALDAIEEEAGVDAPPPPKDPLVEFEVHIAGEPEITVVARGEGAREEITELLRRLRERDDNS